METWSPRDVVQVTYDPSLGYIWRQTSLDLTFPKGPMHVPGGRKGRETDVSIFNNFQQLPEQG